MPTFVARNAHAFASLAAALDVAYDDFIRTSADPRHRPVVESIWQACAAASDLYRVPYAGWYCAGCEQFVDRACDEHEAPPEWIEEENWYFRLSRYADEIRGLIERQELRIVPADRANEVLAFLATDVRDISVSRSWARTRDWGIPVPGDPEQIIYVWFDALVNYLSAAPPAWWASGVERRHVVGKGIVRFHAVIWPAILLSAGRPLPDVLFVHDYVTTGGRKIGKSLGNAVDPSGLIDRYGVDALRWWLLREVPRVGEADFTEDRLVEAANRDLANGVGNLVQRLGGLGGLGGRVTDGFLRQTGVESAPKFVARTWGAARNGGCGGCQLRPPSGVRGDPRRGGRGEPRDRTHAALEAVGRRADRHRRRARANAPQRSSRSWRRSSRASRREPPNVCGALRARRCTNGARWYGTRPRRLVRRGGGR